MLKILIGFLVVLAVVAGGGVLYLTQALPKAADPPEMQVVATPELLARGEYLAEHVSMCVDCHSGRDFNYYAGPVDPSTRGQGGEHFGPGMGVPGDLYAPNITPAGVGDWTDGELARAITEGVNKDGEALFPLMPYMSFARMTRDDLEAVIAYMRTWEPVENTVPERKLKFPMNLIVNTIPRPREGEPPAYDPNDPVSRGEYLTTIAACSDCHTMLEKGKPVEGMEFAGGFEFEGPWGFVRSANITPDKETGIGKWSRQTFVDRFKQYEAEYGRAPKIGPDALNTIMPWPAYAGMTREDLGAIYEYLMTLKPVKHAVTIREAELVQR